MSRCVGFRAAHIRKAGAPLKKGFAYPAVLILLAVLLSAAGYFTVSALRWRQLVAGDLVALQARQMAESAIVYASARPPFLVRNNVNSVDRDILFFLEGFNYQEDSQGFRIVQNKNTTYFIGYVGSLPEPQAVKILYTTVGGKPRPWYD